MRSNIAPEPGETIDFIVAPLSRDASGRQVASAAPRSRGASFLGVARSLSFNLLLPLVQLHVAALDPLAGERAQRREVRREADRAHHHRQLARAGDAK